MGNEYLNGYAKFDDLDMIIQNQKLIRNERVIYDDYHYFIWIQLWLYILQSKFMNTHCDLYLIHQTNDIQEENCSYKV